jgi:hypothetical protein
MDAALALAAVAAGMGSLHTLAPDHWVPFAALARADRWSMRRTAVITAACGLGHVTVSVALGLVSLFVGLELMRAIGQQLEQIAGLLLRLRRWWAWRYRLVRQRQPYADSGSIVTGMRWPAASSPSSVSWSP